MFQKILVANRGEIAVRVLRACQELAVKTAVVFSEADRHGRHVALADESWLLQGQPGKVYLDIAQIIELARRSGAEAIHPGYGFLAENPEFAQACREAGIVFIGPEPEVIARMGSKVESRRVMEGGGVPVVPGTTEPVTDVAAIKELGIRYGYPLAIKASAGGGGRGLRLVRSEQDIEQALSGAQREGQSYFGCGEVYVEKYLDAPRHIEVQILADNYGNVIHLGERDCSSQRRHQKLLEESPAPNLDPLLRERLLAAAVQGVKHIGYSSAGTVECLVSGNDFYFLEMNTRVQVEHPVTEFVTGVDIVKEQIRIASGLPLSLKQSDIVFRGHSLECRINAEDPFKNFMPSPGTITCYQEPGLPWVRIDSACYSGYQVLPFYDSLLAKVVAWGWTREEAIERMKLALKEFRIEGVATTIPFHQAILNDPSFLAGRISTGFVESEFKKVFARSQKAPEGGGDAMLRSAAIAEGAEASVLGQLPAVVRQEPRAFEVEVNQKLFKVSVTEIHAGSPEFVANDNRSRGALEGERHRGSVLPARRRIAPSRRSASQTGEIRSSMHGLVKEILVKEGDRVTAGQKLLIFEAMKMESEIVAQCDGKIEVLKVKAGETVEAGQVMIVLGE